MLDGRSAGIPTHQVSLISLLAAAAGACVGYYACQWASRHERAAKREAHSITAGQLDAWNSEQPDAGSAVAQKADPYDPLPRQGYASCSMPALFALIWSEQQSIWCTWSSRSVNKVQCIYAI